MPEKYQLYLLLYSSSWVPTVIPQTSVFVATRLKGVVPNIMQTMLCCEKEVDTRCSSKQK